VHLHGIRGGLLCVSVLVLDAHRIAAPDAGYARVLRARVFLMCDKKRNRVRIALT
jgi:hypothetical protein